MPQVVAFIGEALITYEVPAAVAQFGAFLVANATIIGYTVAVSASLAYSSAQNAKARNALKNLQDSGRNVMARDPLAVQRKIYGQIPLTGPVVFMHTTGTKNEYLHLVIVLASHECEELGTTYFENQDGLETVPLDGTGTNGGGNATGKYAGYFYCNKYKGVIVQGVDAVLTAAAPTKWDATHTLRGHAYIYARFQYNADLYPNGLPTLRCMVKGAKVLDPRVGIYPKTVDTTIGLTWGVDTTNLVAGMLCIGSGILPGTRISSITDAVSLEITGGVTLASATADISFGVDAWSNNSALCAADYLGDYRFGRRIPWSRINRDGLSAEANVCDESIVTDTGSEKRYTTNGVVTADSDALDALVEAMAGKRTDTGGTWSLYAGAYRSSSLAFTDADLVGPFTVQTRQSMRESYSGVRGTYISDKNNWQPADFPAVKSNTYSTKDGGVRRWKDVAYAFTTSPATAQRLAKADLHQGREQIVVQALYRLKAINVQCGDTVQITRAALGWATKEFQILKWSLRVVSGNDGNVTLAIAITARSTSSSVWTWADGEETNITAASTSTLPDPWTVTAPGSVTLTANLPYVNSDGTVIPRIRVQWPTPNNVYVESGGKVEVEYRENGTATWIPWALNRGDTLEDYIIGVKVGLAYNVRVRFINQIGVTSAWVSATSAAVVGDTTVPNSGSSLTATAYPGYILVEWQPSTNNAVNEYMIFRAINGGAFALLASVALTQFNDDAVSTPNNYAYKVRAVTASEVQSADLGPTGAVSALNPPLGGVVPSAPSAPASSGSGTYDASDGSVFSYHNIDVAALPANGIWQNLLYRRDGATDWLIGAQVKNSIATTIRLDDLTPGIIYNIAVQAWSGAGGSTITSGSNITAPTKTTAAGVPTSVAQNSPSGASVPPLFFGSSPTFGALISWTNPADKDFDFAEVKVTGTNTDGATDYAYTPDGWLAGVTVVPGGPSGNGNLAVYSATAVAGYVRVRSVNTSGVRSAWVNLGGVSIATVIQITGGAMALQAPAGVAITGGSVTGITDIAIADGGTAASSASGARTNLDVLQTRKINHVPILSGGSLSENFTINHGFGISFTHVLVQCVDGSNWEQLSARYDYANGSNNSNNTVIRCTMMDGTNIPAGAARFIVIFFN